MLAGLREVPPIARLFVAGDAQLGWLFALQQLYMRGTLLTKQFTKRLASATRSSKRSQQPYYDSVRLRVTRNEKSLASARGILESHWQHIRPPLAAFIDGQQLKMPVPKKSLILDRNGLESH